MWDVQHGRRTSRPSSAAGEGDEGGLGRTRGGRDARRCGARTDAAAAPPRRPRSQGTSSLLELAPTLELIPPHLPAFHPLDIEELMRERSDHQLLLITCAVEVQGGARSGRLARHATAEQAEPPCRHEAHQTSEPRSALARAAAGAEMLLCWRGLLPQHETIDIARPTRSQR
jgi:hypothetical protein